MATKSELYRTISGYQYLIQQIENDIEDMSNEKTTFYGYATIFATNKSNVKDYDMTVGDTWKKDLCDTAQTKQTALATAIGEAVTACNTVRNDLDTCITNARALIADYNQKIAGCQAEIAAIEAAEQAAAEGTEGN